MNPLDLTDPHPSRPLILIIDHEESRISRLKWETLDEYEVRLITERKEALEFVKYNIPPIVILDLGSSTPSSERRERVKFLEKIHRLSPHTKVIITTEAAAQREILHTVRLGAFDFLITPLEMEVVRLTIQRALYVFQLEEKTRALEKYQQSHQMDSMIGSSRPMQEVFGQIRKVAPTNLTVLITGETGTGKELVAKAIHGESPRKDGPFVTINCAAIPESLLESELFGYEKGAFTGAYETKKGRLEYAQNGTLFLDEIGELSCVLQAKLLRFLQEQTFHRIGGKVEIPLDVRVISATNRDIVSRTSGGSFREDLYYRISTLHIHLPPLRDREEDVIFLAKAFLIRFASQFRKKTRFKGFTPETMDAITTYSWPGNVREMENRIKRAILMSDGPYLGPKDLGLSETPKAGRQINLKKAKEDLERSMLIEAFTKTGGRMGLTAKELGISRQFLTELVEKHGLKALKKIKSHVGQRVG